jgi:predicted PurR-regulated permease PerM
VNRRTVATVSVIGLGLAIGLAVLPFIFGLLGAPILAVTFAPLHGWLRRHSGPRRAAAGAVVTAILAIFLPAVAVTFLLISELPAVLAGPELSRVLIAVGKLRIGPIPFGENLATVSADVFAWLSRQVMSMIGGLTFLAINLLIAFMGLYFLLRVEGSPWRYVERYAPFSAATIETLRVRFHDVTRATILGIGATALAQGIVIGGAFALVGLPRALLWGTVTGIASVLPFFGSALVWVPATALLVIDHRHGDAAVLALIGFVIASNVDNVIRPVIFRRVSDVHPLVAVVGAFAGMRLFGLIGLLLGPLALVYFLELLRAYDRESHAEPAPGP